MSSTAPISVRVARKTAETADICTLELVSAQEGAPLPAFSAGSHVDIFLPGGLTRQYSLCNDPRETHRYVIGVLRDPVSRGGSRAVHDQVNEGQLLQISTPKNHFPLVHDAKFNLLLAGGIGITPLLCMSEHLAKSGAEFGLHYCTRSAERTAFRNRIEASSFSDKVQFHFDDGDDGQKLKMTALLNAPQNGTHLYVCGPAGFMDTVLSTARANAWPESHLHYEFFAADVVASKADTSFEIQLASTGRTITVNADQTVIKALSAAGVELQTACEQGVCGTCLTRVIAGIPDHKDKYLTPEEQAANDQFLPCCSRAKSAMLVLDL